MSQLRRPSVAGLFYPDDPQALQAQVRGYIDAAARQHPPPAADDGPKALIAPHAGYIYSGPVAGSAYARIANAAARITRVVLLGPAHRLAFRGLAYSAADQFATPLGRVAVDQAAIATLTDLPQVQLLEAAFDGEHCLEVQLPFLQVLLQQFSIVPLLVGDAHGSQVSEVLERLWGGPETLIVVSSDLSHYLDYASARDIDRRTVQAICDLQPERISTHQACGRHPIAGLLQQARRHHLHGTLLDLRNSGDTAGPRDRVVGYGACAFNAAQAA
ncbi:AmmeMemoRadiSam system protein B [Thiohalocapsa marina]|uniref:MEMO1 family protein F2Q65_17930 n=1 Tax=Thiohalocapsa marina TaxID=424902 RepID=A0A5M8FNA0_9GAMM|nr:AmmeMemoRadiSam system protein B [Thiohalocapsa marina]KAA6182402.1 AmmeMemoRadiSam system protein B [Thiohalocapsa marina]